MKFLKRLLILFCFLFILGFIAASFYVKIYGRSLVERALNTSLKRNVVLGKVSYRFPLGFGAQNVRISQSLEGGEFLEIRKIVAQLSPDAIFRKKFAFDSVVLIEPSVVIENVKGDEDDFPGKIRRYGVIVPPVRSEGEGVETSQTMDGQTEISIGKFIVKQGRLLYIDGLTEKGFSFSLEDVQLKVGLLVFPPKSGQSEFNISALLIKKGNPLSGSHVEGAGWIDIVNRDMEARIEVVEEDGTVGLTAQAVSRANDMEVKGEIKMQNLLRGVAKSTSSETSTVNDLVLNALSSAGVKIGARFSFKTKMDNFQLGQISFSGNVVTQ